MSLQQLTLELDVPPGVDLIELQNFFRAIADGVERMEPGDTLQVGPRMSSAKVTRESAHE